MGDLKKIGEFLRQKRNEEGLRLEDIADDQISAATLSHIENGKSVLAENLNYYASKLGYDLTKYPNPWEQDEQKKLEYELQLIRIEFNLDLVDASDSLKELDNIKTNDSEINALVSYMKGRAYLNQKKLKKAETCLKKALDNSKGPLLEKKNLAASCYQELSRIAYFQDNLDKALEYVNSGLNIFIDKPTYDRSIKYVLSISKVIYLDKMDRTHEALQFLDELWKQKSEIENVEVLINMYDLYASIYKDLKKYNEAISFAKKGIQLTRYSKAYNRAFELWATLGRIYNDMDRLHEAETCLLTAVSVEKNVLKDKKYLFSPVFIDLGYIYIKLGNWDDAENMFKRVLQQEKKSSLRYNQALVGLGIVASNKTNFEEAEKILIEARDLALKHNYKYQAIRVLKRLAKYYQKTDSPKFVNSLKEIYLIEQSIEGGDIDESPAPYNWR
jgi:tetratricopeptide (TPR) repeat protein